MLRREPFAFLPALLALTLAAFSLPARAEARLISLCSGGSLPGAPDRDCDTACHVGCPREKKGSGRL
jgi:hypothetical protein